MEKLNNIRKKIDKIDNNILDLLEERSILAKEVVLAKKNKNIFNPLREEKLIKKLVSKTNFLKPEYIEDIWRLLISENILNQGGIKIFLGPEKEVEETARWYFRNSAIINVCKSNFDAFSQLVENKFSAVIVLSTRDLSDSFEINGFQIKKIIETPIFKIKSFVKVAIYKRINEE